MPSCWTCGNCKKNWKNNREKFDIVTSRAVANLALLSEISMPLVKVNGYFIALRGKDGESELDEASLAIKKMSFEKEETYKVIIKDYNHENKVNIIKNIRNI